MISKLHDTITSFVDTLARDVDAHTLEDILYKGSTPHGRDLGGYEPEAYTEDELIYPILETVLGLTKRRFPYSTNRHPLRPDFELVGFNIIGENKPLNKYDHAVSDLENQYLRDKGIEEDFGIATDGLRWGLIRIDTGGDFRRIDRIVQIDLRPVAQTYAVSAGYVGGQLPLDTVVEPILQNLVDNFGSEGLRHHIDVAPQRFRNRMQGSVDEFYELYIQLLFGEGGGEQAYDTTLLDDIESPPGATNLEKRIFAITLVNRLLFIKMLEEGGVLPEGFLSDRVEEYRSSRGTIAGGVSLFEGQIIPIFYDLFNTPRSERDRRYRAPETWFVEVPYLNGGLFRENVPNERGYKVNDRILPILINDLIEGHKLEQQDGLDPAVLGNVFEMTINHISGEEGRQKDIGAYYTPGDASRLVAQEAVDGAIRDTLIDVYAEQYPQIKKRQDEFPLSKILRWIEDGRTWFGDPELTELAYKRVGNLRILDPACGSGHFLTSAVTELHQTRVSLMRAMGWDSKEDWGARIYRAKEAVVRNCIYGVDIDPIAVEIAKLRVWLKIIEEGWTEKYGRLPNIDLNVVTGNSLIGLPEHSRTGVTLDLFQNRVARLEELREEYKQDNEDVRDEIANELGNLQGRLNAEYIDRINSTFTFQVNIDKFDDLAETPINIEESNFAKRVASITFRRSDSNSLSDDDRDWFERRGFVTNPNWGTTARLVVGGGDAVRANATKVTRQILGRGFHVVKIERYPVSADLEGIEGNPFHWGANFPEALTEKDKGGFDVLLGNPPYGGSVLSTAARVLLADSETGDVRDVVAPFVERALQLLRDGGYYGNVLTLRVVYQASMSKVRDLLRRELEWGRIACFARRPTQVFKGCQVRIGIIVGKKNSGSGMASLETSEFLRFFDNTDAREREKTFEAISYAATEGLSLGDKIGSGKKALPKIGTETLRGILLKLKSKSATVLGDISMRGVEPSETTEHVLYRRRGISYFMNPLVEDLYDPGERPSETQPIYFESQLERDATFLILQSSLFYAYWMVYGDERHLNWSEIDAMPFPNHERLNESSDEIAQLTNALWSEMAKRWVGGTREVFRTSAELKPLMDLADDLVGPMYDLNTDEVEFVKHFQESYRLSGLGDPEHQEIVVAEVLDTD